jgi:cytochrome c553
MKPLVCLLIASAALLAADDPYAVELFAKHCASCHQSDAGASGRIPQIAVLKTMSANVIQRTLDSGIMKSQAAPLSADERAARELLGHGVHHREEARGDRESMSRERRLDEWCVVRELGRRLGQHAVSIHAGRGD